MVRLELPHVNLLTKVDLLPDRRAVEEFLVPDPGLLLARCAPEGVGGGGDFARRRSVFAKTSRHSRTLNAPGTPPRPFRKHNYFYIPRTPKQNRKKRLSESTAPRFRALNAAVAGLLDEFSLVSFLALDITDEDSIAEVLGHIDMATQYGEDADVRVREFDDDGDGGGGGGGGDGGGDGNGCEAGGGYE
jgi:hypothetical protein